MKNCHWLAWLAVVAATWSGLAKSPPPPRDTRKPVDTANLPLPNTAKNTAWGPVVDGLSCRLLADPVVTHGQPIRLTLQVRNQSNRTRYIIDIFDFRYRDQSRLSITGPDGKAVQQTRSSKTNVDPRRYRPIKPGEVRTMVFLDNRSLFARWIKSGSRYVPVDGFGKDGDYALRFAYQCPKMQKRYVKGSRSVQRNGKNVVEKIYGEPTKEQLAGAWAGTLQAPPITIRMRPMRPKDLTVHEWGVFTVFAGAEHANLNRKAEWGSLPAEFYRQFPTRRLRWSPAAWDKPIVYFYTEQPSLEIDVQVRFADGGAPVVWWPAAAYPLDQSAGRGGRMPAPGKAAPRFFDSLHWTGWLGSTAPGGGWSGSHSRWYHVREFDLPKTCWLQDARLKDAAPFTVVGSRLRRSSPWITDRPETERFIYYDGLVPAPDHLHCIKTTDNTVTVKNSAKFSIGPLFLIDRRPGVNQQDHAWALTKTIPPGATLEVPLPNKLSDTGDPAALVKQVRQALLDAGLYETEAEVLLKVWHKNFFESDGVTAIHLLPAAEYNRMLPLQITPRPAELPVRVGVAYHPQFEQEPHFKQRVEKLIRALDAKQFTVRESASQALKKLGPWAVPLMQQAVNAKPSLEKRRRLERILANADAGEWLRQSKTLTPKK